MRRRGRHDLPLCRGREHRVVVPRDLDVLWSRAGARVLEQRVLLRVEQAVMLREVVERRVDDAPAAEIQRLAAGARRGGGVRECVRAGSSASVTDLGVPVGAWHMRGMCVCARAHASLCGRAQMRVRAPKQGCARAVERTCATSPDSHRLVSVPTERVAIAIRLATQDGQIEHKIEEQEQQAPPRPFVFVSDDLDATRGAG